MTLDRDGGGHRVCVGFPDGGCEGVGFPDEGCGGGGVGRSACIEEGMERAAAPRRLYNIYT